ncbi:hypothetical protein CICLE_v10003050mg [Citrus x clementina]|uniref:Uncharacterized protein n=1 Tax=Citrus clementina TaxID=85681 RepID=V4V0H5_CITCL|nr:hypothetical protein CICLE_v10003050mg [Citrus x clementina]
MSNKFFRILKLLYFNWRLLCKIFKLIVLLFIENNRAAKENVKIECLVRRGQHSFVLSYNRLIIIKIIGPPLL